MQDIILLIKWSNQEIEERIPLFGQTIRIGHDAYSDIVLPEAFKPYAPRHATIKLKDDGCYIYPEPDVRTVYMNGKRLDAEGMMTPDIVAYIGSPTRSNLYLILSIADLQMTQVVKPISEREAASVSEFLENLPPASLPESINPYLLAGWGEDAYEMFDLLQDATIVGRNPAANITVSSQFAFVSGLHFQIIRMDNHYFVQDRHSTNGTRLNKNVLVPGKLYHLMDGDIISIQVDRPNGLVWFVFHDPLKPSMTNFVRQTDLKLKQAQPSLWERVWGFLTGK